MKMNARATAKFLILVCCLFAFVLLLIEFIVDTRMKPPAGLKLQQISSWCPECNRQVDVQIGEAKFVVVFSSVTLFPIKEYPAGYVFSANGELVCWSPESSDVDKFSQYWKMARESLRRKAP